MSFFLSWTVVHICELADLPTFGGLVVRGRYAADSVLGVASIPMKRLMKFPLIDGYAHVQGATNVGGKIEDVSKC